MIEKRISKQRLIELERCLCDRDKNILTILQKGRYLTSGQVRRLTFTEHSSQPAAIRAANRVLLKLQGYGLISALQRRIGGVRGGSGANVWSLTEAGHRLLSLNQSKDGIRKRMNEPSVVFLEHTLAISEAYVQITEICTNYKLELVAADFEPACWRGYTAENGKPAALKPDLYAVIASGEYEDCWFIEIDLNTEAPCDILAKCERYVDYYKSGIEQKQTGVFPQVVWIVPGASRKESLRRHIAQSWGLRLKNAFIVITPDELPRLLVQGPEALTTGKGDDI